MSSERKVVTKGQREQSGDLLEITVDESKKSKYIITLPLSYDFEISPVDARGNSVPVSSITNRITKTIIRTPGSTSQWKLRIMKSTDQSHLDPTGDNSEDGDDESGDKFDDWLRGNASDMDEEAKIFIQNAKRKIIFQKE